MIVIRLKKAKLTRLDRPAVREQAKDAVRRPVLDTTRKVVNQATANAPVNTGNLRAHHRMTTSETANKVKGTVTNDAKYAAAVHNGSRPHTIAPRRRKVLRFTAGGSVIYARSVRHPGNAARPWLARAAQQIATTTGYRWTVT